MRFKVEIELLQEIGIQTHQFESSSSQQILASFQQIDWERQKVWGFSEEHQGEFPVFQIEHVPSERKFGGLFVVYSRHEFNFMAHAELYQKQQKSSFFGLFKSEALPSFDCDLPFEVFQNCLEKFIQGNDAEIERLMHMQYPSYVNNGIYDK